MTIAYWSNDSEDMLLHVKSDLYSIQVMQIILFVKTDTKTETLFFVLEAPQDQDCGREDCISVPRCSALYSVRV